MTVSACCMAQDSLKMNDTSASILDSSLINGNPLKDCVIMKNGQMMVMKNGQTMKLNRSMTMQKGVVVMPDGTVTMSNGSKKQLKDGQCVYMDGKIGWMKKNWNGPAPDSTMKR